MARTIDVQPSSSMPIEQRNFEMCEHKGVGHPDTLTDGICEAASRELSRRYLRETGRVLHHNLDKGLLLAGRSEPRFGGGRVIQPMKLLICGRATPLGGGEEACAVAIAAARHHLHSRIGFAAAPDAITAHIGPTSTSLQQLFGTGSAAPRSNDTSFGTGFAPYSRLERMVLGLAGTIRSAEFLRLFPAAGADFKIMGCRLGATITLTLALAFVDRHVQSVSHYVALKKAMHEYLAGSIAAPARLLINRLDDPQAGDESGLYLTVTGLSGEMGDDGQVGRGNRVSGLITPGRAMSLEAAAGKNPVSHVGKLYNVLATLMARDIHAQVEGAEQVSVQLLSAIGMPIDQPELAGVEIHAPGGLNSIQHSRAAEIVNRWLADVPKVTRMILDEEMAVY
ncbi:MAG TPA: methionine adenosyltransferase [Ideonella sp.]|uniref:methionine adenosyltransferase n=1 Tax=Ideonella sp. TaxID=1929293 RepID=UPI002E2F668E|nr:methionine adenosyltransferase [Ideonella sp.]HEX5683202.1 methionine adenosyltransferase [Ideonella sp.]